MTIRFIRAWAGNADNDVSDFSLTEEARLVAAGIAEYVDSRTKPISLGPQKDYFMRTKLPKFAAAKAQTEAGFLKTDVALIGDSLTLGVFSNGQNFIDCAPLSTQKMIADILDGQWNSSYGTPTNLATFPLYDRRWSLGPEWSVGGLVSLGNQTIDCDAATNLGSAMCTFTPTSPVDKIDIMYLTNPAYGQMTVGRVDEPIGGTINQTAALSLVNTTITLPGAPSDKPIRFIHTVTGALHIIGVSAYNSKSPGLNILRVGRGGGTSAHYADVSNIWTAQNCLKAIAPKLSIIAIGVNDAMAGTAPATFNTNLQSLITAMQISGDVVLCTQPPISTSAASLTNQNNIANEIRTLATSNNLVLIDLYNYQVSYDHSRARGFMYTDGIHQYTKGYKNIADYIVGSGIFNV
jgi:lysophospholipase L1-like esterase